MVQYVAREIVNLNIDEENNSYVNPVKIANLLNRMIFNGDVVSPDYFKLKSLDDAIAIISEIIKMSIDIRVDELGSEQSKRILRDILLQNLDFQ
jgi:hypothetical protein